MAWLGGLAARHENGEAGWGPSRCVFVVVIHPGLSWEIEREKRNRRRDRLMAPREHLSVRVPDQPPGSY